MKKILIAVLSLLVYINVSAAGTPVIFPIPQQMELTADAFAMDETVLVALPVNASEKDKALARMLIKELSNKHGIALVLSEMKSLPANRKVVIMGTMANSFIKAYCAAN